MKKPLTCCCLALLAIALSQDVTAQKSKTTPATNQSNQQSSHKTFDDVAKDPGKEHSSIKKDLSILLEPLVRRIELEQKQNPKPGELSFFALLEDAPIPVYELPKAKNVDAQGLYAPYLDQVDRAGKDFAATYTKHAKKGNINTNKNMGKDAQERMNNPSAPMGNTVDNAAMNKLMQDMIKDPKLAARFEKMSDKEKEAFMKPYFKESVPRNDDAFEKTMAERNQAQGAFNFTQLAQETGQEIIAGKQAYANLKKTIDSTFEVQYKKTEVWFKVRYEAIPNVVVGEGHDKDPKQLANLYQAKAIILYTTNQKQAELLAQAWHSFKAKSKHAIGKLDAFVGNYKWGSLDHISEQGLLGAVQEVYGLMGDITAEAKDITVKSKTWQLKYEEAISPYR